MTDPTERAPIATRLARLYDQMGDPERTIGALEIVRIADPDDFDALAQLCDLCEKTEKWDRLAELLAQRIEIEGDEAEAALLTRYAARRSSALRYGRISPAEPRGFLSSAATAGGRA